MPFSTWSIYRFPLPVCSSKCVASLLSNSLNFSSAIAPFSLFLYNVLYFSPHCPLLNPNLRASGRKTLQKRKSLIFETSLRNACGNALRVPAQASLPKRPCPSVPAQASLLKRVSDSEIKDDGFAVVGKGFEESHATEHKTVVGFTRRVPHFNANVETHDEERKVEAQAEARADSKLFIKSLWIKSCLRRRG